MGEERYYDEYEIDLREYIMLLWDRKWFIIGIFIIAVLGAFLFSKYYLTPSYETEATIYAPDFELVNGQKLTQNDYISFMRKNEIEEKVIDEFSYKENNNNFSIQNLDRKLSINTTDSNLINISFVDSNTSKMSEVLGYWISLFQEETIGFLNDNNENYINSLEQNMINRRKDFEELKTDLKEFKKSSNVELLRNRLNNKETMLVGNSDNNTLGIEEKIVSLNNDIVKYQAQLEKISEQLKNTDEFITSSNYLSDSSLRILRNALPNINNIDDLTINEETINTEYTNLITEKNKLEQNIASAESNLKSLKENKTTLEKEIENLQVEVSNKESELESLQEELTIAKNNYEAAEEEYSEAEQELSSRNYEITVINSPIVPQSPISPNTKLNVAIAGVLALMLGIFIVFFREFLKEDEETEITA